MKTLLKSLPLIALAVAQPAFAQQVEGDDEVALRYELVDTQNETKVEVVSNADFGQVVRPVEDNHDCLYRLSSDGSEFAEGGENDTSGIIVINSRKVRPASECVFNSSTTRPRIAVNCPAGRTVTIGGELERTGVVARVTPKGQALLPISVTCEDGTFEPEIDVTLALFSDVQVGQQTLTVPFEVTFE